MARGNQRDLARAKNLKKQADQVSSLSPSTNKATPPGQALPSIPTTADLVARRPSVNPPADRLPQSPRVAWPGLACNIRLLI